MPETATNTSSAAPLPGLPRQSLTPKQQLEALQRLQDRAEQRVKLGVQLFKAAEAHVAGQQAQLGTLKAEHEQLRERLEGDFKSSMESYDRWLAASEERTIARLGKIEQQMAALREDQASSHQTITQLVKRAEAMLSQAKTLMSQATAAQATAAQAPAAEPTDSEGLKRAPVVIAETAEADTAAAQEASASPRDLNEPPVIYTKILEQIKASKVEAASRQAG